MSTDTAVVKQDGDCWLGWVEEVPGVNAQEPTWGCSQARFVKVREVIKQLELDGWALVVTRGSHRQFKNPQKPGRVTVAGGPSDELAPGTLKSIAKQSGVSLP